MAISAEKLGDGIAIVSLAKEPVNSMDLDFWRELLVTFESLEADPKVKGVLFQSKLSRPVFTAGLDLKELHVPSTSQARLKEMWMTLTKVLTKVYSSRLATAAAILGACPAGGCGLALCCDYRVITKDGSMGLNEVALGIPVPKFWCDLMTATIGQRSSEKVLLSAAMTPSQQALELGLVDALADSPGDLVEKALAQLKAWLKFPSKGFMQSKSYLRADFTERWRNGAEWESEEVWKAVSDPACIASLDKVMARLSGGKAKAKL